MSGKITIFVLLLFLPISSTSSSDDVLLLSKNETLASPGDVFELGFFNPGKVSNWYLGIWLKQDPDRTALWVANRDHPLLGSHGTLRFFNSNLILFDRNNNHVWSTSIDGTVRRDVVVKLLKNGNLVVKEAASDTNQFLWQSFDFPTDSIFSGMKMRTGTGNKLKSWINPNDPSTGVHFLGVTEEISGFWFYEEQEYGTEINLVDLWNGYSFGDMPPIFQVEGDTSSQQQSLVMTTNHGKFSRLRLGPEGIYEVYTWFSKHREWNLSWSVNDSCFLISSCKSYSFCSAYTTPRCNCIEGFSQKLDITWTGCTRVTNMSCSQDRFTTLHNMKLPNVRDVQVSWSSDLQNCEENCLANCHCTAWFVESEEERHGKCVTWYGELEGMRNYTFGGHDLHVRIAPTDHGVG
ncbi:S-locus-specific glycoprotein S13-like [Raphanus sativus]|uniref:S-locus-specific glycoprotein S13-like n=1 Tax=Raphanus sativus TaxID=3726 RepID=A0A9W3CWH3_RAPSA|nr:S-locus-specific glycoprotein S13-like [Raphanus sativus]